MEAHGVDVSKEPNDEPRATGSKGRKRKGESQEKPKKKYKNILLSSITVRQLRALLVKVDQEDAAAAANATAASASAVPGQQSVNDVNGSVMEVAAANETKIQRSINTQTRKSRRINRARLGQDSHQEGFSNAILMENQEGTVEAVPMNAQGSCQNPMIYMKTFSVAAISMGLFLVDNSRIPSNCSISFCFFSRIIRYNFSHNSGSVFYSAGYRISFDQLEAITFQGKFVNIKLAHPAELEFCNRESYGDGVRSTAPCNDFDVTLGQYKVAIVHVIRLNSDDDSDVWIYHLLDADRQFFAPLITNLAAARPGALARTANHPDHFKTSAALAVVPATTGYQFFEPLITNATPNCPGPSKAPALLAVDPTPVSLFGDHPNTPQNPIQKQLSSHLGNMIHKDIPTGFSGSAFTAHAGYAYPVQQQHQAASVYIHGEGTPLTSEQSEGICTVVPQHVNFLPLAIYDNGYSQETAASLDSSAASLVAAHFNEGSDGGDFQNTGTSPNAAINSAYVLSTPEPVDSEYVPQKSDSQYILSDLDMLFP